MKFTLFALFLSVLLAIVAPAKCQSLGPPQVCRCFPVGSKDVCPPPPPPVTDRQWAPRCQNRVKVDISFVADDGVSLYICGIKVRQSSNFDEMQTFTYENMCDSFMLEVTNKELSSGVSLLATINGQKYGTTSMDPKFRVPGTLPMFAIATFNPQGNWFQNPPGFDFSSWTPAVVVDTILGIAPNLDFLASQGAFPINVQTGNVAPGIYGLKLFVPFC